MAKSKLTRILAIDYGAARIGLALSDAMKLIASPYKVLRAAKKLSDTVTLVVKEIESIEKEKECIVEAVVIGMPYKMSGAIGLQADEVLAFKEELEKRLSIPLHLLDERLTTVQGERMLRETEMSRKKRSEVIDLVAATIILQSFLDIPGQSNFKAPSTNLKN